MSGKPFECGYGAIVNEDVEVLERCLQMRMLPVEPHDTIRVCEIGAHDGNTGLGIKRFLETLGFELQYWGIEPDPHRIKFIWEGATLIVGDSSEVFHQVPGDLDLVWVDGCHCFNHVALDTLHYAPKVRVGGFICYHDINPLGEGAEHQYHGPVIPEFGLATNQALKALRFPWPEWELFMECFPADIHNCGTRAYRRIA